MPGWIRAARMRHREMLTPVQETQTRLILGGQRIVGRSGTVRTASADSSQSRLRGSHNLPLANR